MNTNPRNDHERLSMLISYAGLFIVGYLAWRVVSPFFEPLAWAAILAVVLYPFRKRMTKRLGVGRASLLCVVLGTLLVMVPAGLLALTLLQQSVQAATTLRETLANGIPAPLQDIWDRVDAVVSLPSQADLLAQLNGSFNNIVAVVGSRAARIVTGGVKFSLDLSVTLVALYFFLRDSESLSERVVRALPFDEARREALLQQARGLILASVSASFAVALAQGTIGGIGFAIVGIPSPVFWGCLMGFLSLLPLLGAASVWLPAAAWLMISGHMGRGLILIVIGAGVISTVDNIIRPLILRGRTPLNVVILFISVLGGVGAFGFIGIVLGPVIVSTALSLLDVYTDGPKQNPKVPAAADQA